MLFIMFVKVMRRVLAKPLTLALMRAVCREVSISRTARAGMPLARLKAK
jgi:hypothetical protein